MESVFAFNTEVLGPEGTLGAAEHEVVLTCYLGEALVNLNPGLPDDAYQSAIRQISETLGFQSITQVNREKYALIRDLPVSYRKDGEIKRRRLRVFDFDTPENNHFLCAGAVGPGPVHRRQPDLIGFVNGLPLLFVECKRPDRICASPL